MSAPPKSQQKARRKAPRKKADPSRDFKQTSAPNKTDGPEEIKINLVEEISVDETRRAEQKRPLLKQGNAGAEVRALQEALRQKGFEVTADGTFGPQTERAVALFQQSVNRDPTGIADEETQESLFSASSQKSAAQTVKPHTISDRPLESKDEDALGFTPYVDAVVAFLRSLDTQPPLAIGINAPWGRGKTSFMKMLDSELKDKSQWFGSVRFATDWFNPWKYSNDEQVWAAFVGVITRSVRDALNLWGRLKFEVRRFWHNAKQHKFALFIRFLAFAAISATFFIIALDPSMRLFSLELVKSQWGKTVMNALELSWLGKFLPLLGGVLVVYLLYVKVIRQFNINLLDHLKATDFKDKIGTLAQFEKEMQILNDCMPKKSRLKVVIFVDDLDRCKPTVLWEVIEALQLLAVSQRCIFVLGMDLKIVAKTIDVNYPKLSQELADSSGNLQHGWGYRFLEKVIQTQLSVPTYGQEQLSNLVQRTLETNGIQKKPKVAAETAAIQQADKSKVMQQTGRAREIPKDSEEVIKTVSGYGSGYFTNPRRLKRFINNFRLHAYLANMTGFEVPLDKLARFLVLIEKWPGLIEFFRTKPEALDSLSEKPDFGQPRNSDEASRMEEVTLLLNELSVARLFNAGISGQKDLFLSNEIHELCNWYGFRYYR